MVVIMSCKPQGLISRLIYAILSRRFDRLEMKKKTWASNEALFHTSQHRLAEVSLPADRFDSSQICQPVWHCCCLKTADATTRYAGGGKHRDACFRLDLELDHRKFLILDWVVLGNQLVNWDWDGKNRDIENW